MMYRNTVKIRNLPEYAFNSENPFWVVRASEGEWWFYGAYESMPRACDVAVMEDGEIVAPKGWEDLD